VCGVLDLICSGCLVSACTSLLLYERHHRLILELASHEDGGCLLRQYPPGRAGGGLRTFAAKDADRFSRIGRAASPRNRLPTLDDALAWVDCQLQVMYAVGDHVIAVGPVLSLDATQQEWPLLFYRGGYARLESSGWRWGRTMTTLGLTPDQLLTTTRSVRRRLDLTRGRTRGHRRMP
jgi:hypothetical protein